MLLAFLRRPCSLNDGLEQPKSDLIFKHSRLRNNFIFGMLSLNVKDIVAILLSRSGRTFINGWISFLICSH